MSAEQDQDQAFLKSFGIIMLVLAIIAVCSFFGARLISAIAEPHGNLPEQGLLAQKRTAPVYHVVTDAGAIEAAADSDSEAGGGAMSGEEVFKATCHTCHVPGVLDAPKLTDSEEWEKRFSEQGLDELYANAIDGIGNMPPKGGNASLTQDEMHAAVDFILSKAGVKDAAAAEDDDNDQSAEADDSEAETTADSSKDEASSDDSGDQASTDAAADGDNAEADTADSAGDNDGADAGNAADDEASSDQATADAGVIDEDAANTTGKKVFKALCHTCHVPGIAGAPKVDDTAEWESRLSEQGLDKLHHTAIQGIGAMPPKGGDASLSDAEVEAAVNYMLLQSGAE